MEAAATQNSAKLVRRKDSFGQTQSEALAIADPGSAGGPILHQNERTFCPEHSEGHPGDHLGFFGEKKISEKRRTSFYRSGRESQSNSIWSRK